MPLCRLSMFGGSEELGLPSDSECHEAWLNAGVPDKQIEARGAADNFWDMGTVGPCGPCTEIHYGVGREDMVELWNIVFMQYDRQADGSLSQLPRHNVDTGMGLERLCTILQGVSDSYKTDLFTPLIEHTVLVGDCPPYAGHYGELDKSGTDTALRVVADHVRMATVCIADGARPHTEHRLAKVITRAAYLATQVLHCPPSTLSDLSLTVAESLGDSFPRISDNIATVRAVLSDAESRSLHQLEGGRRALEGLILHEVRQGRDMISGDALWKLYCQEGLLFTTEMVANIAKCHDVRFDHVGFQARVDRKKSLARRAFKDKSKKDAELSSFTHRISAALKSRDMPPTNDQFKYELTDDLQCPSIEAAVVHVELTTGEEAVVLNNTNMYSESGGQVGDHGTITSSTGTFTVNNVQCTSSYVIHLGRTVSGSLTSGQQVVVEVDKDHRARCRVNHSATHLLRSCLEEVVGCPVDQRSSLVSHDKLRLAFSGCDGDFSDNDVRRVEEMVCGNIRQSLPVSNEVVPWEDVDNDQGVKKLPGELYPPRVRLVTIGGSTGGGGVTSRELCGGTHVTNTRHIGHFVITSVTSRGHGVREVTAVTGDVARDVDRVTNDVLMSLSGARPDGDDVLEVLRDVQRKLSGSSLAYRKRKFISKMAASLEHQVRQVRSNKGEKRSTLEEEINQLISKTTTCPPSIVHQLTTPGSVRLVKDCLKTLHSRHVNVPVFVVAHNPRDTSLLLCGCYVPDHLAPRTAKSWMSQCVPGDWVSRERYRHPNFCVTSGTGQDTRRVMDRAREWTGSAVTALKS